MKIWQLQPCQAPVLLGAVVLLAGQPAIGGAYLPLVGPPALRFAAVMQHPKQITWATFPLTPAQTNQPAASSTNQTASLAATLPASPNTAPTASALTENPTNSASQTSPANNLLVVTPEMLVDYFKPDKSATNQSNVRVLAPVNFTPPPQVSTPSSQAIYESQ